MKTLLSALLGSFLILSLASCASSTESGATGVKRKQLLLTSSAEVDKMAAQGYDEMKQKAAKEGTLDRNAAQVQRVDKIVKRLVAQAPVFRKDASSWAWESHVITSPEVNAFCMPGGKMMIYTGLIEKLNATDGEIAAVMGHEIAHALREHGRERISEEMVKQGLLQISVMTGVLDANYANAAANVSNLLVTLPHSRGQESEADQIGVELMARAGYNPEEALSLWKKMGSMSKGAPPEILSTHPSDDRRLKDIAALIPKVMPLYKPQ